ncbi:hypothetical protein Cni_G06660 [Canna indica]|uniref:Reverse transcriptase domain-containing protein n=1 Tax=Canna indica TaxID=4628 RepID=A0AAQ3JZS4_9LILI|nr:hypothetical protein Cni_G06660 [Canna indica]
MGALSKKVVALSRQIQVKWWSKSKRNWIEGGDQNTKYFHNIVKMNRRRNEIEKLEIDDKIVSDNKQMANGFADWYKRMWKTNEDEEINPEVFDSIKWNEITQEDGEMLVKDFKEKEMWIAANSLGRGKSSGIDGYILEFYLFSWDIIKGKLKRDFDNFHRTGILQEGWNDTVLTMIPKKDKASQITKFRPIALCNVMYKMLAKLIANRMRPLLNDLIGQEQAAFIPKRQMHDNTLIVSEIVESLSKSKSKNPYIIVKLDLEKAYDRTNWKVIYQVMERMKFPKEIVMWIKGCLERIKFCYKINGETSYWFNSYKGIRQGNPLSPYLFIIMEQLLSAIINNFVKKGKNKPYKIKDYQLSHLSFADDIILVVKGNQKSCKGVMEALKSYYNMTGQKINMQKSECYFPVKCEARVRQNICNWLEMREGKFPMMYLGTMISHKRLNMEQEEKVVSKVERKIETWAKGMVSQAGKCILINSVVCSIPAHSMMTSWVSERSVNRIVKIAREFFWATGNSEKPAKLIGWKKITARRSEGGLGIRDLFIMKKALVGKGILPLLNDENENRCSLLKAKYNNFHP